MDMKPTICDKFGGSTFADHKGFDQAAEYLSHQLKTGYRPIAVVSAPKGVSDLLIDGADGRMGLQEVRERLDARYRGIIANITDGCHRQRALREIEDELARIELAMEGHGKDCFLALGENHSGILLSNALRAHGCEATYDDGYHAGVSVTGRGAVMDYKSMIKIRDRLQARMARGNAVPVIGGYVGKTPRSRYKLMGRNTTDVTGALVSCAAKAVYYEIVKDVPGVFRVEPEFCQTGIAPKLSYGEAGQITWRGAKVVHPSAISIARKNSLTMHIRNMDEDSHTLISEQSGTTTEHPVAAISAGKFYMLNISDDIMNTAEGRGYLERIAGFFSQAGLDIFDAAMPANTISITIPSKEYERGKTENELRRHLSEYGYSPDISGREVGGISMTGEAMRRRPGTLSQLAGALSSRQISITMSSQSDEAILSPTINFYVDPDRLNEAVQAMCKELFE